MCDLMRSTGDFEAALELYQRAQGLYDYAEQIAPDRDESPRSEPLPDAIKFPTSG